jgi:cyanophycinase-like exopeptidase
VDLAGDFLDIPFFEDLITDTHFKARDRMGRLIGFLARLNLDQGRTWRGIGVDQDTAVVVDPEGRAEVMGPGAVYLLQPRGPAEECSLFNSLTYREIQTQKFISGDHFKISGGDSRDGLKYRLSVVNGNLSSDLPSGSIY